MTQAAIPPVSFKTFGADFEAFSQALGDSFARYGFAVISDHGLPDAKIAAATQAAKAFFAQSDEVKRRYVVGTGGQRGYTPYAWKQGFNFGPKHGVLKSCREQLQQVASRHGEKASLIGWSLGGVYARELAKEQPENTRCVITLGTPFNGHPRATNAWRLYKLVSGQSTHDPALIEQIRGTPPCPTTSIYSKTDGIVAWQCSLNGATAHTENIEVRASHIGMGMNPLALYAVADRLRQDPQHWQPFDVKGARRWFYKVTHRSPLQASSPAQAAL